MSTKRDGSKSKIFLNLDRSIQIKNNHMENIFSLLDRVNFALDITVYQSILKHDILDLMQQFCTGV